MVNNTWTPNYGPAFESFAKRWKGFDFKMGPLLSDIVGPSIAQSAIAELNSTMRQIVSIHNQIDWSSLSSGLHEIQSLIPDYSSIISTMDLSKIVIPTINWAEIMPEISTWRPGESGEDEDPEESVDVPEGFYDSAEIMLGVARQNDVPIPDDVSSAIHSRTEKLSNVDWKKVYNFVMLFLAILTIALTETHAYLDGVTEQKYHEETMAVLESIDESERRQAVEEALQTEIMRRQLEILESSAELFDDLDDVPVINDESVDVVDNSVKQCDDVGLSLDEQPDQFGMSGDADTME